jgi:hypothetical protein
MSVTVSYKYVYSPPPPHILRQVLTFLNQQANTQATKTKAVQCACVHIAQFINILYFRLSRY